MKDEPPECLVCGACCFSRLPTFIRVTGDDHQRLGPRTDDMTHFSGNRCYMRMGEEHCVALRVERDSGRYVCQCYAERPGICRQLVRGSAECAAEWAAKGKRARAAMAKPQPGRP